LSVVSFLKQESYMSRLLLFISSLGFFAIILATATPAYGADGSTYGMKSSGYPVKVYFSKHPESDNDPKAVFSVSRTSPDLGVAKYAIQQLVAGPTASEKAAGYFTELQGTPTGSSDCNGEDFTIALDNRGQIPEKGTATLRFCRSLMLPGEMSDARVGAEINATLTQFPTIKKVVVLVRDTCLGDLSGLNLCLVAKPNESTKMVLPETSIDGPALWTAQDVGIGGMLSVLGWTGRDPQHHVNVMYTVGCCDMLGLFHFVGKRVLPETSIARPAVFRMSESSGGAVVVAWTGTDPLHRLNILYDVYGSHPQKLTLNEESPYGPAITSFNGNLMLAWSGTDAAHHLNVIPIKLGSGLRVGTKTTLWSYGSIAGPGLITDVQDNQNQLLLTWTSRDSAQAIYYSGSRNGTSWSKPITPDTPAHSNAGPSILAITIQRALQIPRHYWAWTSKDNSYALNVEYTLMYPQWGIASYGRSTLSEACLNGPVLGFTGGANSIWVAWTGTDPQHHLNVAEVNV
jgi:Sporulation and spore germination